MSATRQFWKFHYDLLQNAEYLRFMQHPSHITYIMILKHVYRGPLNRESSHELYPFFKAGWLAARPSITTISEMYPRDYPRSRQQIMRDIAFLEEMGLLDTYPWREGADNEPKLMQLGSWGWHTHPNGKKQYAEVLYVDRLFAPSETFEGDFFD